MGARSDAGQGLARAYTLAGNRACAAELLAAERGAREARRGLWAEAAYQVRAPGNPGELLRYGSTFQIVEGRVVRVGQGRDAIYLNFSARWRGAFSASLRRGEHGVPGLVDNSVKALEGKRIRVRGWIETRRAND